MNLKQAIAFIIVVSNGPGLMNTSTDRIIELKERFSVGDPLWHLDELNEAIYRDWLKKWGVSEVLR